MVILQMTTENNAGNVFNTILVDNQFKFTEIYCETKEYKNYDCKVYNQVIITYIKA